MKEVLNHKEKGSVLSIIDFSPASMQALKWASQAAGSLQSHLTILYPYRLNQLGRLEDISVVKKNIDREAVQSFKDLAEPIVKDDGVTYDFRAEVGFVSDRVSFYSSRNQIRMIVMSKMTATANTEALNDLLEVIPVPLVIVP
jgi:hypothetical protein